MVTVNTDNSEQESNISSVKEDEKQISNKKNLILGSIISLCLILILTFSVITISRTPEYALYKTIKSIKTHDYKQAIAYVNIDKIADARFQEAKQKMYSDPELVNNPFAGIVYMFVESLQETMTQAIKNGFQDIVASKSNAFTDISDIKLISFLIIKSYKGIKLEKNMRVNDYAYIYLLMDNGSKITLIMTKNENSWQIVDIIGYDFWE